MSRPRVAINLPGADVENPARLADHARQAEQLGFESVWIPDLVNVEGAPALEPLTALAVAAGATERIGLGVGVLALAARPLALIATQIASLQLLSGGRLLLGVGLGGPPTDSMWSAVGKSEQQRGRQFDAAVDALGHLLAGETADLPDGRRRSPARLEPVPPTAPGLLVGGQGAASMRRAVTLGADWLPSLFDAEGLAAAVDTLRQEAARQGRPVPGVTVGVRVADPADTDAIAAFRHQVVDVYGQPPDVVNQLLIIGTPREIGEQFDAFAAAGADRLLVAPIGGTWTAQSQRIAEAAGDNR